MRTRLLVLLLTLLASPALAQQPGKAIPIARISYVEGQAQLQPNGKSWTDVREGGDLRIGDQLRTGPLGQARIDFPWMSVALSGASRLAVPPSLVLSTVLEEGRVEVRAPGGDIVKLLTAEARIRGEGRVAVRRVQDRTLVSVLEGSFRVDAGGKIVTLEAGEGTIVSQGSPPLPPMTLPPPPSQLDPGDDPVFAATEQPLDLSFKSSFRAHHLQLLGMDSAQVLIERDVAASPVAISLPWPGTYRWRVSSLDVNGLEGLPSREGLITVYSK